MRLVLFDAFATLIKPRQPIAEQYAQVFKPHFTFEIALIKSSFKSALKKHQADKPVYSHSLGASGWWSDVIRATAIGAGAESNAVDLALPVIVPALMEKFSSKEGYELYPDVLETLAELKARGIALGVVSNSDSRVRAVLQDLEIQPLLDVCVLSEEEGVEKPDSEIWRRAIRGAFPRNPKADASIVQAPRDELKEVLHVGDELEVDYHGAKAAGLNALLVRRPGIWGFDERREEDEDIRGIDIVRSLREVVSRVEGSRPR